MNIALSFVLLLLSAAAAAQQPSPPELQPRSNNPSDDRPTVVLRNHATSVLPEDGSGLYLFQDPGGKGTNYGEGIQINEQFGDVTGYLTEKAPADHNKIASYFFNHIEGGGGELSFTTKAVHGTWYSFEGKLVRGAGATPVDVGYYMLDGALIAHDDVRNTTQQRSINLKRTGMRAGP